MEQSVKSITDLFAEHSIYLLRYTKTSTLRMVWTSICISQWGSILLCRQRICGSLRLEILLSSLYKNFFSIINIYNMDLTTLYILLIIFVATLVRSTFGFGESLIAVPLLVFFIPIEIAVPVSVLVSIVIAAVVVVQDKKQVHFYSAKWLIIYATIGIPIGLYLLIYGNENLIKSILGAIIILYSSYSLFSKKRFQLKTDNRVWLFVCGFLSGVFGGAYGINGPPLVIYGNMRNWSAQHFRATLQAYFLFASTIGMIGYLYKGLWSTTVSHYFLISLPVILPTIFLGRYLNQRLKNETFLKYVYVGLIFIGMLLLKQSIL